MSAGGGGGEAATPDELIGGAPLLVFAAEACPYCLELRRELASAGLEPEVHMLDASGREALRQRTGQRTVPYVFVGERFVGGCDDGPEPWMGAMPLLRSGALQQLLDSGSLPADAAALQATARTPVPRRNVALAAGSALAAASLYAYQRLDPLDPVTLLRKLEAESPPLPQALASGRGTLVEFYAPWCAECREMAPMMYRLEKEYAGRVNFVLVDGADPKNEQLVSLFSVDGVPHFGFISAERKLLQTLIGNVPRQAMEASLRRLL